MEHLTAAQFSTSFFENVEEARIIHTDSHWEARCHRGALATPEGKTGFANLQVLLSILAGVGIRRMDVEWDGLPVVQFGSSVTVAE